jgi:peptide-methionine (R)-S-oxide reductase
MVVSFVVDLRSVRGPSNGRLAPSRRNVAALGQTVQRSDKRRPMPKVQKTEQEWRAELTPKQYRILREKGTERPFSGEYDHVFEPGTYVCAGCGAELFGSDTKYDSGCGWPAFYAPAGEEAVKEETDASHGMIRTEVMCTNCGGHLGHVFPDGPAPTAQRYCINSAALKLEEE